MTSLPLTQCASNGLHWEGTTTHKKQQKSPQFQQMLRKLSEKHDKNCPLAKEKTVRAGRLLLWFYLSYLGSVLISWFYVSFVVEFPSTQKKKDLKIILKVHISSGHSKKSWFLLERKKFRAKWKLEFYHISYLFSVDEEHILKVV